MAGVEDYWNDVDFDYRNCNSSYYRGYLAALEECENLVFSQLEVGDLFMFEDDPINIYTVHSTGAAVDCSNDIFPVNPTESVVRV